VVRRVLRYLINSLAALSLTLCIATVVIWVRSYRVSDVVDWRGRHKYSGGAGGYDGGWAYAARGRIVIVAYSLDDSPLDPLPEEPGWRYRSVRAESVRRLWMPEAWPERVKHRAFREYDGGWSAMGVEYSRGVWRLSNDFATVRARVVSYRGGRLRRHWAYYRCFALSWGWLAGASQGDVGADCARDVDTTCGRRRSGVRSVD
jgi:hypothetical protein